MAWTFYDETISRNTNIYHGYLNLTDEHMYSMNGTDLGTGISFAEAESNCKIVSEVTYDLWDFPIVKLDNNNYPHIAYWKKEVDTARHIYHISWNGASWNTSGEIGATPSLHPVDISVNTASDIDAYVCFNNENLEKWHWNGSSWSKTSTIIDGGGTGNVISVSAAEVSVSKFTIRNSGSNASGIWASYSSNNDIYDNTITNSGTGIALQNSHDNNISGNTISNIEGRGIELWSSRNNKITENTISLCNRSGIYLEFHCDGNTIDRNKIDNNDYGVYLQHSSETIITENTITNNWTGIYLEVLADDTIISGNNINSNDVGVFIQDSRYNIISENIITNSTYVGIELREQFNTVSGNIITNAECGIRVERNNITITGNQISNTGWGIHLFFDCTYNNITGNTIRDSGRGILLDMASYNIVADNTITNNGTGISFFVWGCVGNTIVNNTITNSTHHGIYIPSSPPWTRSKHSWKRLHWRYTIQHTIRK